MSICIAMENDNKHFCVDINLSVSNRSIWCRPLLDGLKWRFFYKCQNDTTKYRNFGSNEEKNCFAGMPNLWLNELDHFKQMNQTILSYLMFDVWYEFFNSIFN